MKSLEISKSELQLLPEFVKLRNESFGLPLNLNGITLMGTIIDELFIHIIDNYERNDNLRNCTTCKEFNDLWEHHIDPYIVGFTKSKQKISKSNLNRFINNCLLLIPTTNESFKYDLKKKLEELLSYTKLNEIIKYLSLNIFDITITSDDLRYFNEIKEIEDVEDTILNNVFTLAEFKFSLQTYYTIRLKELINKLHKKDQDKLLRIPSLKNQNWNNFTVSDFIVGQQLVIKIITDYEHITDKEILELHNLMMFKPLKSI